MSLGHTSVDRSLASAFDALWEDPSGGTPDVFSFLAQHPTASTQAQASVLLLDQFHRWQSGVEPRSVESYLERWPAIAGNLEAKHELVVEEYRYCRQFGPQPDPAAFIRRFPDLDPQRLENEFRAASVDLPPTDNFSLLSTSERSEGRVAQIASEIPLPARVGRYRVIKCLGGGAFGRVYLGRDETLRRDVAIKVPNSERLQTTSDRQQYLNEARILAQLDDFGIVPIYDFGETDDGSCFLVSKFIAGGDLNEWRRKGRLSHAESAEMIASLASALA